MHRLLLVLFLLVPEASASVRVLGKAAGVLHSILLSPPGVEVLPVESVEAAKVNESTLSLSEVPTLLFEEVTAVFEAIAMWAELSLQVDDPLAFRCSSGVVFVAEDEESLLSAWVSAESAEVS